jgi:beta-glucosidase
MIRIFMERKNGFQSKDMIAILKHFAGHGEPRGGRDSQAVGLSERWMREFHLVPFRAAIEEAHAGGVMAAYSTWDGTPDNASTELLQNILRQEWGFDGGNDEHKTKSVSQIPRRESPGNSRC